MTLVRLIRKMSMTDVIEIQGKAYFRLAQMINSLRET